MNTKGCDSMQTVINIFSLKINSVSNNGSVNIGDALHNAHTANTKSQGQNSSFGDYAPPTAAMENVFIDPDINDMGDIANPSNVYSNPI
jgi:Spore germination protein gerPA/gerPF